MNHLHVNGTISSTRVDSGTIFANFEDKATCVNYCEHFSDDTISNVFATFADFFKVAAVRAIDDAEKPDRIFGTYQIPRINGRAEFYEDGMVTHSITFGRSNSEHLFCVNSEGEFTSCHMDTLEACNFLLASIETYIEDKGKDLDFVVITGEVDMLGEEFNSLKTTRLFIS